MNQEGQKAWRYFFGFVGLMVGSLALIVVTNWLGFALLGWTAFTWLSDYLKDFLPMPEKVRTLFVGVFGLTIAILAGCAALPGKNNRRKGFLCIGILVGGCVGAEMHLRYVNLCQYWYVVVGDKIEICYTPERKMSVDRVPQRITPEIADWIRKQRSGQKIEIEEVDPKSVQWFSAESIPLLVYYAPGTNILDYAFYRAPVGVSHPRFQVPLKSVDAKLAQEWHIAFKAHELIREQTELEQARKAEDRKKQEAEAAIIEAKKREEERLEALRVETLRIEKQRIEDEKAEALAELESKRKAVQDRRNRERSIPIEILEYIDFENLAQKLTDTALEEPAFMSFFNDDYRDRRFRWRSEFKELDIRNSKIILSDAFRGGRAGITLSVQPPIGLKKPKKNATVIWAGTVREIRRSGKSKTSYELVVDMDELREVPNYKVAASKKDDSKMMPFVRPIGNLIKLPFEILDGITSPTNASPRR